MTGAEPVEIRAIAAGGDGVGTLPDGRTVFVPRTAPGDRVLLRSIRARARFARARIDQLAAHGPGRVVPPCPHYVRDDCGACQLMHLDPAAQRAARARIVGDALRRIARLDLPDPEVVPAEAELGYRAKVSFAVRNGRIGYHQVGEPDRVVDVVRCLLARPELQRLHAAVRGARALLPPDAVRVILREDADGGLHLVVDTPGGRAWSGGGALHRALVAAQVPATVWWHPADGAPRAVAGAASPWPATVFEQVHPAMGRTVRTAALVALAAAPGDVVWDLYAGIGDATVALAGAGAVLTSVESDPRAVALAEARGPSGPTRLHGRVEDRLRQLPPPTRILVNPPRTGLGESVAAAVAASGAGRVVYISCDPATLARDIARMSEAYRLTAVQAFDQFPQTAHVETVVVLEQR